MSSPNLEELTIADISSSIKGKKLSPVDLTRAILARIKESDPILNAYVTVTEESALRDAKVAEKEIRRGRYRSALHGIPFSIKDNIATSGIRTTAGSKILSEWIPDYDATVVERLRAAGAIILGKTNMHEWAAGGTTINPFYGTTCNPWNLDRIAGGSSGGSAAAVGASLCLGSIGTDNAGSVRNPASFCGIVGLKATYGRISRFGDVPGTGGFSTDHFGILAKTVKDTALILKCVAGIDTKDPLCSAEPVPNFLRSFTNTAKGLTLGVLRGYAEESVSAEVRRRFDEAVKLLQSIGMRKKEITIPHSYLIPPVQLVTSRTENASSLDNYLRTRPRDFSRSLLYRQIAALTIPAAAYNMAQRVRRIICEEFARAFDYLDVIVTPTTPLTAPTIDSCKNGYVEMGNKRVAYQGVGGSPGTQLTIPFNLTGLPAISVCCGFSASGLPVGLQIVGHAFGETTIFKVAHCYERAAGWYKKHPTLMKI